MFTDLLTPTDRKVNHCLGLPYNMTIEHREDQGGYCVASYIELSDLTMTGSTPEKAVKNE